jgi:hypothetical protein
VRSPAHHETTHECRQCCALCDRVVHPSGCIESGCPYLYSYDDEHSGRRFIGCLNKVFRSEIDLALFHEAERTRQGFGAVRLTGTPLQRCQVSVERAYDGYGEPFDCVNPDFFEPPLAADPSSEFDLRDSL